MEKILKIVACLCFTILGCKEALKPVEVIPTPILPPVEIITIDTTAYATKEPFVNIKDRGFEAYLVVYGTDTDNQINGKISVEDADKVNDYLMLSTINFDEKIKKKYAFLLNKYKLKTFEDNGINGKYYLDKFVVSNLDDLKVFPNLKSIFSESVVSDSVVISHENKITEVSIHNEKTHYVNIDGCKELTRLFVSGQDQKKKLKLDIQNLKKLELLSLGGNMGFVNLRNNEKITNVSLIGTNFSNYDFSEVKNLYSIFVNNSQILKKIMLPKSIRVIKLFGTGIENIDLSSSTELSELYFTDNFYLKTLDVSGSSNVYVCNSSQNPLLSQILLNPEQKIDSLGGAHGGRFWLKDPWTKWEYKK